MAATKVRYNYKWLLCALFFAWIYLGAACSRSGSDAIIVSGKGAPLNGRQTNDVLNADQAYKVEEKYAESSRGTIGGLEALVLVGTYEEMGRAHGVLAGRKILDLLNTILIPYVNGQKPGAWDSYLIPQSKQFKFPEAYERELQGIFYGIKEKFPDSKERQLTDLSREISIDDLRALNCFIDIYLAFGGCSSFSAWGSLTSDGEVISGRNLDERYFPGYKPLFMVIARRPTVLQRMATIDVTGPGLIGASTSINEDGVLVMGHDEKGLKAQTLDKWIPRSVVLREVIETLNSTSDIKSIKGAFEHRSVKVGNNAHLTRSREDSSDHPAIVIEWDSNPFDNGATIRLPEHDDIDNFIVCTNHYVNRRSETFASHRNSLERYETLIDYLTNYRDSQKTVVFQDAVQMMNSVAANDTSITYYSVISFPEKRELYIAVSPEEGTPATQSEWTLVTWDMLFGN